MNATYPYYWGDTISLLATPDEHWEFYKWTGVGSEHLENEFSPSTSLTIQKDSAINAEFRPKDYTLTVSFEPDGYGGYSSIENIYNYGNIAEIEAILVRENFFMAGKLMPMPHWRASNHLNMSNPAQFTILGNAKLTALFKSKEYNISYQVVVEDEFGLPQDGIFGGRILGRATAEDEEVVEFHISLANGYKLDHWRNEANQDIVLSTETIYTHEMLDLNLTAVVTERKYEVDLKNRPSVGGNAQLNDFPVSESLLRDDFSYGDDINIFVYAEEGYRFVKWDATGSKPRISQSGKPVFFSWQ